MIPVQKDELMLRVAHVFNEYCPAKGPWRHWIASNPNVNTAIFCMRRSNEHLSPHDRIYVDSTAEFLRNVGRTRVRRFFTRPAAFLAHRYAWNHFLREFDPEVLHVQFADKAARILPMLSRAQRPIVVTCHGSDVNTAQLRGTQYLLQLRQLFRQVTLFQCVSKSVRDSALRCGCPPEKLRVLHIGCPVDYSRAAPTSRTTDCVFACVGALVKNKGHHTMLCAFRQCLERMPQAELHLFGDGPEKSVLTQLATELGIRKHVLFHGHLEHALVQKAMREVDVAILVSEKDEFGRGEGMPVSLKEAGALGLPSIGTRCDGIPELVLDGETGIIIEQRDQNALANALAALAANPELRSRLGAAARKRISENFNLDIQLKRLADFYAEAIEMASRPTRLVHI
jgi:glycosyltransferase involved in cell wall biosynthesis